MMPTPLTVPHGQAYGFAHGLGRPQLEAHESRANLSRGFFVHNGKSYGRSMWEGAIPAGPLAGRPTRMESPTLLVGGERLSQPQLEDFIMANANSQGEIRPAATRPVTLETAVKRLRRFLAKMDHQLVITRDGSKERELYGQYFVRDEAGKVLADKINLVSWLRSYALMADDEELADAVPEKWHTIVLRISDESGVTIPRSFQVRSKHFSKPVRDALRDGFAGTANRDVDQVADRLMTVLSGWRHIYGPDGRELEFNRENIRMLADNFLGIGRTIIRTLLEALAKEVSSDGYL